jgi:hypothetical protein
LPRLDIWTRLAQFRAKRRINMSRKFTWTVKITVDETWVADGFDLTKDRLEQMIGHDLSYACSTEYSGKILKSPDDRFMAKAQGYKSAADYRASRA